MLLTAPPARTTPIASIDAVARPSLHEFAGGDEAMLALTTAFHERCMADPDLNHPFSHGISPHHVENLARYWAEVFGGPPSYSRVHGGHSAMLEVHARKGGESLGPNFVSCFMLALDDARLPEDPEFRASMRRYIEWATDEVNSYAPAGRRVEPDRPMPRWSWEGPIPA